MLFRLRPEMPWLKMSHTNALNHNAIIHTVKGRTTNTETEQNERSKKARKKRTQKSPLNAMKKIKTFLGCTNRKEWLFNDVFWSGEDVPTAVNNTAIQLNIY